MIKVALQLRLLLQYMNNGKCHRKHHHGGGRVAQPETDEPSSKDKSEYNAIAAGAGELDDSQGNPSMQFPFLNS